MNIYANYESFVRDQAALHVERAAAYQELDSLKNLLRRARAIMTSTDFRDDLEECVEDIDDALDTKVVV